MTCILAFLLLASCAGTNTASDVAKQEYQVTLYVSSQDATFVNPVDIQVKLDNKTTVVDRDFYTGTGHNNTQFDLILRHGDHQLIAKSTNGDASIDVVFTVDGRLWLVLDYWGKNHFQFSVYRHPVLFQ